MKLERWRRIDQLLEAALERRPEERAAFLSAACVGDESLRMEVEALLRSDEAAESFIEEPAATLAAHVLAKQSDRSLAGQRISHYKIMSRLGAGGMGEIYLAEDLKLARKVAIKFLPPALIADEQARRRLLREARAAAALDHPNICTIYEVGEEAGRSFIVMQYIEGETLAARIKRKRLELSEALDIAIQAAEALQEAHQHGIIHRDIKPQNLMLTARGQVKVLDFGLAKSAPERDVKIEDAETISQMSTPGTIVGTAPYMSPEQARGEHLDVRSDIFSFGASLYETLSRRRPFVGNSAAEILAAILTQDAAPMERAIATEEVERIVRRCLEKDLELRYQTVREVAIDLENARRRIRNDQTFAPSGPEMVKTVSAPAETLHVRRRSRLALRTVSGIVILAALTAIAIWRRNLPERQPETKSLVILPFKNLSGNPEEEYFAEGVHDALIGELALIGALRVISRQSAMKYKGSGKTTPEIARELNVDGVVEGSVHRKSGRVNIQVRLMLALPQEKTLWADNYERDIQDVLMMYSDVARAVTRGIKVKLTPQEDTRLASAHPVNPEAYEAYLKGIFHRDQQTREDYDAAERHFLFALQKDPKYALAYAGLGSVWMGRGDSGFLPPLEVFPKAKPYLDKAVELDDSSAAVHVYLANHIMYLEWDWVRAEKEFRRALELNPNHHDARFFYADLLAVLKRNDEWKQEMQRARELDPLNEFRETYYGWQLNYMRRYDEAISLFQKLLPSGPNKAANYLGLWGAYYKKGMYDEALASARDYFVATRESEFADGLGTGRDEATYRAAMKSVGEAMATQSKRRHVPANRIARMFAHSGDKTSAIRWLEISYQRKESPLIRLAVFWDWDNLRSDPQFHDLLRRMNLPQN
jgi:serine/threonine protein kinase